MIKVFHHPFSTSCRFVRLICGEYGVPVEFVVEKPWERRRDFLLMNPAGTLPVLVENDGPPICGATVIMEYLDETRGYTMGDRRLMPGHAETRAEVRRLVDWFLGKFDGEVVGYLVHEKIFKLEIPRGQGGGEPDSAVLRAARANIRHHLKYIGWLTATRDWLAGQRLSFADLAAAAALSCVDYLGEVPWDDDETTKAWYGLVKSRPSFRPILADRILAIPPAATYVDLDF
ncbi:glutathione S-transferase family protein [Siculibacillus lacustris]|uniref:Glutathione S-transferase family protein n=1 Tax=Siculibacillus lacustris TaxID=1549641 RepID=A0A4Q9VXI6_9HYPH|nr:glutathione S-transferase family protein [Siculibacillus lacustris]TBW41206.1 glutathione S-transferase family protein [Siculibacillus lacustris]